MEQEKILNIIGGKRQIMEVAARNACTYAGKQRVSKREATEVLYEVLAGLPLLFRAALWSWARTGGEMPEPVAKLIGSLRSRVFEELEKIEKNSSN